MAINFMFGKNKTINITIKDHAIRFVELKQTQPLMIQRMGERYLPAGLIKEGKITDFETLSTILEQCVTDWKIAKRNVRFLVPDSFVVIRKVPLPKEIKEDEIKGYLYMEMGTSIHLPFEDPVFDYILLDKNEQETNQILLFAAPEEVVREYMDLFDEVKLKPIVADLSSLALNRFLFYFDSDHPSKNHLLIQLDLQTVNVSIFEQNVPVFNRHLTIETTSDKWNHILKGDFYSLSFSGETQEILGPIEDVFSEIEKVINFYQYSLNQGKQQVERIILDGDHPWLDVIYDQMKSRFSISITKMNDIMNENVDTDLTLPPFHLNIGLGLKEV
ncbi:pilus assembly protein PilM [Neobacillus niacini]|uniref:type IV pilus biogenesis protein PilM n=1 Tax=Neobacillus niacini TaxID=86668 RepID=UPI00286259BC|nr:pilus assembly protein PilM [Neobacillus niacini]MDR7001480.1 type IV pilus assembly protein PilM [Neobacillus niacini]